MSFFNFNAFFASFSVSLRRPYISLNGMSLAAQKHRMATEFGWMDSCVFFVVEVLMGMLMTWGTKFGVALSKVFRECL